MKLPKCRVGSNRSIAFKSQYSMIDKQERKTIFLMGSNKIKEKSNHRYNGEIRTWENRQILVSFSDKNKQKESIFHQRSVQKSQSKDTFGGESERLILHLVLHFGIHGLVVEFQEVGLEIILGHLHSPAIAAPPLLLRPTGSPLLQIRPQVVRGDPPRRPRCRNEVGNYRSSAHLRSSHSPRLFYPFSTTHSKKGAPFLEQQGDQ